MRLFFGRSGIAAAALLCAALAGCHHQPQVPPLPVQTQTPNIYIPPPPQPNLPPMVAPPPAVVTDVKPVKARVKPKTHKKPPPPAAKPAEEATPAAPVPSAPTESAATAELGALSPGNPSSPRQQEVSGHISAVEHRLNELPGANGDSQKKQVLQVRLFLKQASDALKTGDAEGAENLATKAGLLLDDIK